MTRIFLTTGLVLAISVLAATPASADTLLVYSQVGLAEPCPNGACYFQYCSAGDAFCEATEPGCTWGCGTPGECDVPEGKAFERHTTTWGDDGTINDAFIGWGTAVLACTDPQDQFTCSPGQRDMTDFAGEFRFFLKVNASGLGVPYVKAEFECNPDPATYPAGVGWLAFADQSGWDPSNASTWQEIAIPLNRTSFPFAVNLDVPDPGSIYGYQLITPTPVLDDACFSTVQALSKITLGGVDSTVINATMSVDYIRWEKANTATHTGASNVTTDGRQLKVDGKPFVVNAVAYQPVSVGEPVNSAFRDRADRYEVDFPLMADLGANAVRLFAPVLTTNMLDAAWAAGLFVIPTFEVDPQNLECAGGRAKLEDRFVATVNQWRNHPAILAWLIGNEINQNLTGGVGLCGDWYQQLDSMALAAETAGSNHPVGTAVAGMTDVCTSCSDDLDLANVDFWGVNLYPGCAYGTAFNTYDANPNCERPLIVTETGVDAFHQPNPGGGGEDQGLQAGCLDTLVEDGNVDLTVRAGGLGVLSGQTLFEWADEWWKAECSTAPDPLAAHDTCSDFPNVAFPDGKVHEEWFGIVALDPGDPTQRPARTAFTTVGEKWLGPVCDMRVDAFNAGTGNADLSFAPPAGGAVDTNLYYGSLSAVSSNTYSGSLSGLGTAGSANVTLPGGDLFWVVAAENTAGEEGCYGTDSAGTERPCFSGSCGADQISGWNCWCAP